MHPQYDLFKSWAYSRQEDFFDILSDQYVLYGEWVYAVHTRRYTRLPHYFHEFDIWDKKRNLFLDTPKRQEITQLLGLVSVPILYEGTIPSPALGFLQSFLGKPSCYGDEPLEGLYGKIEAHGETLGRFKFIDPLFTQTVLDSDEHWIHRKMEVQGLAQGVDLYGT
jgi:hypothetical protein